jgi:hypothetical protein
MFIEKNLLLKFLRPQRGRILNDIARAMANRRSNWSISIFFSSIFYFNKSKITPNRFQKNVSLGLHLVLNYGTQN